MESSHLYRTCIKQGVEEDRLQIAASFQELIRRARLGIRLVNYYKGLLLSYPATLVEMQQGVLELDLHPQQAVALNATGYTFIKCDHFDCAILAKGLNVNVRTMAASLRDFIFVEIMAERRRALRLEMEPQSEAQIVTPGSIVAGKVVDISLEGLSIRPAGVCELIPGVEVTLSVMVPDLLQNTQSNLQVNARHIGTFGAQELQVCRFSLSNVQSDGPVSRYMFQRQVELIRELKEQT